MFREMMTQRYSEHWLNVDVYNLSKQLKILTKERIKEPLKLNKTNLKKAIGNWTV